MNCWEASSPSGHAASPVNDHPHEFQKHSLIISSGNSISPQKSSPFDDESWSFLFPVAMVCAAFNEASWISLAVHVDGRGKCSTSSGKFSCALRPFKQYAATSYALAAISGAGKEPNQMRVFFRGSLISDTHLPHRRFRTPRKTGWRVPPRWESDLGWAWAVLGSGEMVRIELVVVVVMSPSMYGCCSIYTRSWFRVPIIFIAPIDLRTCGPGITDMPRCKNWHYIYIMQFSDFQLFLLINRLLLRKSFGNWENISPRHHSARGMWQLGW